MVGYRSEFRADPARVGSYDIVPRKVAINDTSRLRLSLTTTGGWRVYTAIDDLPAGPGRNPNGAAKVSERSVRQRPSRSQFARPILRIRRQQADAGKGRSIAAVAGDFVQLVGSRNNPLSTAL